VTGLEISNRVSAAKQRDTAKTAKASRGIIPLL